MNDFLALLIFLGVSVFFLTFFMTASDSAKSRGSLYTLIVCIFLVLISWSFLRHNIVPENYSIDREVLITDSLAIGTQQLRFSKELKLEITTFDMALGSIGDYTQYRIFLDSLTYIDLYTEPFDSLHLELGKKLYKEE